MRSRLQENPRPNRPRLQTAWDKGEHDDLDPTAPTEGIEPQQRGSNFIGRRAFDTMKGLGLLFHPGPLDKWIGRKVTWEQETRKWRNEEGEYLDQNEAESYEAYRGRLSTRHELGKAADKLVRIADRYLPKVADETRVFIMRFPHKIPELLKQARGVRKKAKARRKQGPTVPVGNQPSPKDTDKHEQNHATTQPQTAMQWRTAGR